MSAQLSILIMGKNQGITTRLIAALEEHYRVLFSDSVSFARQVVSQDDIDLVVNLYTDDNEESLYFLQELRVSQPDIVRLLGGNLSNGRLDHVIRNAAIYSCFSDEWPVELIELMVRRALENRELAYRHRHLSREMKIAEDVLGRQQALKDEMEEKSYFDKLVYCSPSMAQLCSDARKAANTNLPVLIEGETGTGKELMARAIHHNSERHDQPLLVQNCGGISDEMLQSELFGHKRGAYTGAVSDRLGLFPAANGGTVFLDEISEVSSAFQIALLRFLQEGEVKPLGSDSILKSDVRIIAACNRPLEPLVKTGQFRQDLYFRLNGFKFTIPPLRQRREDIPVLAEFLARKYGDSISRRILGIASEVLGRLKLYDWPGNVRELENEMKKMVSMIQSGEFLTLSGLSQHLLELNTAEKVKNQELHQCAQLKGDTLKEKTESMEIQLIKEALTRYRWNQSKTAKELGLSRVGLSNKIKRYGLADEGKIA